MAFAKGSVVLFKSGGQRMTVGEVKPDGKVVCIWFEGKKVMRETFDPELLVEHRNDGPFGVVF